MKPEMSEKILTNIKKRAKKYLSQKNYIIEKINADQELLMVRVKTHIIFILNILKNENIIDDFSSNNPIDFFGVDGSSVCFCLKKQSCPNVVYIFTNGSYLIIKDGGFLVNFGDINANYFRCKPIEDVDAYDWLEFSNNLLDFIYKVIYNEMKITEISIFGAKR